MKKTERAMKWVDFIAVVPAVAVAYFVHGHVNADAFLLEVLRFILVTFCGIAVWSLVVDSVHSLLWDDQTYDTHKPWEEDDA